MLPWISTLVSALSGNSKVKALSPKEKALNQCTRAIRIYLDTLHGNGGQRGQSHLRQAEDNAQFLAEHGSEGLRLGGRGSVNQKLKYWQGQFSISGGEASEHRQISWEEEIGEKFQKAGLPFKYRFLKPSS
jgi:hypothetical protein